MFRYAAIVLWALAVLAYAQPRPVGPSTTTGGTTSGPNTWGGTNTFRDNLLLYPDDVTPGNGRFTFNATGVIPVWQVATAYSVGQVVYHIGSVGADTTNVWDYANNKGWQFDYVTMTCTTAGTSHATTPPAFTTVGATGITDGTCVWTYGKSNRRIWEIYDAGLASRGGVPVSFFRQNGSYASYRGMTLGGTSNGLTGVDFDLFDPFMPSGTAGWGQWLGVTMDGGDQQALNINTRMDLGYTNQTPILIGDGYPSLVTTDNAALFRCAIDFRGGLNWTGTLAVPPGGSGSPRLGHVQNTTATDSDTGWGIRLWPDATGKTLIQGGSAGAAAGNTATSARGVYQKLAMTDNTATDVARVTIPNVEASATVMFTILSRAADGESTESHTGVISFNRKAAGSNVVGVVGTLASGPAEAADGAQPITTAVTLQDNGEAAGATQTFDIQVTINTNNSAAAECTFVFDFINHQTGGATIAPL